MEQIKRSKKENPYVMLDKTCLNDKELSWQAKGLHSYIMGLPEDWKLFLSDLENRSSDKRDCTANCLNELIAYGYAQRIRLYGERGRFAGYDYTIYESAQLDIREKELPLYLEKLSKRNKKAAENKAKRESEKGFTVNGNSVNGESENGEHDTNKETNDKLTIIPSNNQEKESYIPFPKANKKESKGASSDKGRSNSMRGGADEATKQAFEEFRLYAKKVGMSGARGLETEYEYFTKKHKDYETVIPILLTCLQSEVADREAKKKANEFVPAFKNFLTWVNKRAWETYEKVEVQETSEPNILQMNPQQIADHIRAKIDSKEWTEEEGKAKYKYYQDNRPKKYG